MYILKVSLVILYTHKDALLSNVKLIIRSNERLCAKIILPTMSGSLFLFILFFQLLLFSLLFYPFC